MSLLKKKYKIIIIVIAFAIVLILGLFSILKKNPIKNEFVTISNDYFVVNSTNDNYINVPIYVDIKDTEFMDVNNIEHVYLTNRTEDELFPVEIEYITYLDVAIYNEKNYYQYDVKLNLMFISNEMIKISDLYLKTIYPNDITIKLKLGSLVLYNYKNDENLTYSNLKGLVKVWNNTTMLTGVLVKLSNSLDYTITSIKTISNYAEVDSVYTTQTCYIDEELTPIERHVDEKFNIINDNNSDICIDLVEEDYLFICLNYNEYVTCPTIGFIIGYELDGEVYEKVISVFKYFKTNNINYEINVEVYEANFN